MNDARPRTSTIINFHSVYMEKKSYQPLSWMDSFAQKNLTS